MQATEDIACERARRNGFSQAQEDKIWKKQFSRVLSHYQLWENKTNKLKRTSVFIRGSVKCRLRTDCGLLFLGLENNGTIAVTFSLICMVCVLHWPVFIMASPYPGFKQRLQATWKWPFASPWIIHGFTCRCCLTIFVKIYKDFCSVLSRQLTLWACALMRVFVPCALSRIHEAWARMCKMISFTKLPCPFSALNRPKKWALLRARVCFFAAKLPLR